MAAEPAAPRDARRPGPAVPACARPARSPRCFAFTLVALVPPLLAKLAVDQGIKTGNLRTLAWIVVAFVVIGLAAFGLSSLQTYLTGWVGERALADLRIRLFTHLQRLSLGYFERNRTGAIISRITNDVEALDTLITDGVTSLVQNLMLLVGTAVVLFVLDWRLALATLAVFPLMALATVWFRIRSNRAYRRVRERIGLVTATLAEDIAGMRVVQSYAREPRNHDELPRHQHPLPRRELRDDRPQRPLLPGRRLPLLARDRDRARLRRLPAPLHDQVSVGHAARVLPLPRELLRSRPAAVAALQHVPLRDGGARQDHGGARRGARDRRRAGRARAAADRRPRRGSRASASGTGRCPRCCTGSTSTCPPGRRSRSSGRPAPASRRSRS